MLENSYPIRTDLALESQERLQEDQADMRGIRVLEERRENEVDFAGALGLRWRLLAN